MANRLNFRVLNGANPDAQYAGISDKDAMTIYLLKNGKCYFGSTPIAGGGSGESNVEVISQAGTVDGKLSLGKTYIIGVPGVTKDSNPVAEGIYYCPDGNELVDITAKSIANYITKNAVKAATVTKEYAGNEETLMTSASVVKYVKESLNNSAILDVNFFKKVEQVELTQEDVDGNTSGTVLAKYPGIDLGSDKQKGDIGLVFVFDDITIEGDATTDKPETYAFINLRKLVKVTTVSAKDGTVKVEKDKNDYKISIEKASGLNAVTIVSAANSLAENGNADSYDSGLSDDKFITEKQLADMLPKILKDYIRYDVQS